MSFFLYQIVNIIYQTQGKSYQLPMYQTYIMHFKPEESKYFRKLLQCLPSQKKNPLVGFSYDQSERKREYRFSQIIYKQTKKSQLLS